MNLVFDPETLKSLGEVFDEICAALSGQGFSRDVLAKELLQHVAKGGGISDLRRLMLQACPLTYGVKHAFDWEWQVLYKGTVVSSGSEETSVGARAAAMTAAGSFRLH